jgi:hypothetical protein
MTFRFREKCQTSMRAEFSSPRQQMPMYLNDEGVIPGAVSSSVNAYDEGGNARGASS